MRTKLLVGIVLATCSTASLHAAESGADAGRDDPVARIRSLKDVQSIGGFSLEELAVAYIKPQEDKATGFVVGGTNRTEKILTLESLNGIPIRSLERQMRPGAPGEAGSYAGFLGPSERLLQVMANDNRFVVESQGLAHQELARPLLLLGHYAKKHRQGKEIRLGDVTFVVRAKSYKGYQESPFNDDTRTDTDVTVVNKETGHGLTYSLLIPFMIERYGFYEGHGTSYRIDPKRVIDLFRAEKSAELGRYPRLPFKPATDHELKQALALADPTALFELDLSGAEVTDAGFAGLSNFKNLQGLNLSGTKITDATLSEIGKLTRLQSLDLMKTGITDEGLAAVSKLSDLMCLSLRNTQVGDAGLARIADLKKLVDLNLSGTKTSDEGLHALSKLASLQELDLAETKITDAGLEALLPLKSLARICFLRTKITDKGIMTLTELPALREMQMHGTQVTKEGQQQFLKRKSNFRFN